MAYKRIKEIKGKKYLYLEQSIRIGNNMDKITKYVGNFSKLNKEDLDKAVKEFTKELDQKELKLRIKNITKNIKKIEYPLDNAEIGKIEDMNLRYRRLIKKIHPKNIEDMNKRFIANFVFESNAIEGSSLTLKNVAEIVFEDRISQGKDLREVYEAKNSYKVFLFIQKTNQPITSEFIIKIHKDLMEGIDDRLGYRKLPMILLGKAKELTKPENVKKEMGNLLKWYKENENKIYPLELAFKFHAKFEKIHPFADGNGRVGRFLLNYILMKNKYFPIIIRKSSRNQYIRALDAADREKWIPLLRFALEKYKKTFRNFFEVYHQYSEKNS